MKNALLIGIFSGGQDKSNSAAYYASQSGIQAK